MSVVTTTGLAPPPVTRAEKLVTLALQLLGIGLFLYAIGLALELAVGGVVSGIIERRRMASRIADLAGHHIICGFGRVGQEAARGLRDAGRAIVVIDENPAAIRHARDLGLPCVTGDLADDDVLISAGIERAASLIACADNDAVNTFVALSAKGLQPALHVIGRASSDSAAAKLRRAGADEVVSPYATAGELIAARLVRPQVTAFLHLAASRDMPDFELEEIRVPVGCPSAGRTIAELGVRERTGALILAVRSAAGGLHGQPGPDIVVGEGDVVIGVGTREAIGALERLLGPSG